jgi:hypothetical protein
MPGQQTTQITTIPPEELLRIEAAQRLGAMMVRSLGLLDDCSRHCAVGKSDAIGAFNAAARLIKANADITHALLRAAQGETRHRTIIEKAIGVSGGLNPNFSNPHPNKGAKKELIRELDRLLASTEAGKSGTPVLYDGSAEDDDDDA